MTKIKSTNPSKSEMLIHRAPTPEAREMQLIASAYDLAEKQILEGTASSQIISFFLKLGSPKERLEREILTEQKKLIKAKTEDLESNKHNAELYKNAIEAMKKYRGQQDEDV